MMPFPSALAVLLLAGQPAMTDHERLQGTWSIQAATSNGDSIILPQRAIWRFTFDKENRLLMRKTGYPDQVVRFALDPGTLPKRLDIIHKSDPAGKQDTDAGIYELKGDSLSIAMPSQASADRPQDFKLGGKVIVLRLQKEKAGPLDEIPAKPAAAEVAPRGPEALAGRWELVTGIKAKDGTIDRIEVEFAVAKKSVIVRRETVTPIGGDLTGKGRNETRIQFVLNRNGRTDGFELVEEVRKGSDEVVLCLVRFHFRGELLEMLGEARPPGVPTVNFTGQWKRVATKQP
jgi:uncharacterized protein (TIGR03067 family)